VSDVYDFTIDVPVRNEWSNVSLLVTSVQNCFSAMFANVNGSRTVAMVTGELLENAIKYGVWTSQERRLRLAVSGSTSAAQIRVENPGTARDFGELRQCIDWIAGFPSAEAAYRAKLLALATTTDPTVSRLGIVRIAYEGKCSLAADFESETICVTATLQLQQ
jgi:hypothetical protein